MRSYAPRLCLFLETNSLDRNERCVELDYTPITQKLHCPEHICLSKIGSSGTYSASGWQGIEVKTFSFEEGILLSRQGSCTDWVCGEATNVAWRSSYSVLAHVVGGNNVISSSPVPFGVLFGVETPFQDRRPHIFATLPCLQTSDSWHSLILDGNRKC